MQGLLRQANKLICCDGALCALEQHSIEPDYIIGDCDSLPETLKQKYAAKIHYLPDQNSNDLSKAVTFATKHLQLDNIIILGATGLREDHTLANITLLANYATLVNKIIILSDYGFFSVHTKKDIIITVPGQQISLFALNNDTRVTTSGLKWDLAGLTLDIWYKGTLNQATSSYFELESTNTLLIYRACEVKS